MSTIVLAHCGTGKTYCAKTQPERFLDLPCMPYKYFLTEHLEGEDAEATKATYPVEALNPEYPENYVAALQQCLELGRYEYILAPPEMLVACSLEADGIPYILVYPEYELKSEYEERFIKRGNSEKFLSAFIGDWEGFIAGMDCYHPKTRIRLGSGQYLSDVL